MNWLEAYVLDDEEGYEIASINLGNVVSISPATDEDPLLYTMVMFKDATFYTIKGNYKEIMRQVAYLKDGESAISLDDF